MSAVVRLSPFPRDSAAIDSLGFPLPRPTFEGKRGLIPFSIRQFSPQFSPPAILGIGIKLDDAYTCLPDPRCNVRVDISLEINPLSDSVPFPIGNSNFKDAMFQQITMLLLFISHAHFLSIYFLRLVIKIHDQTERGNKRDRGG